MMDDATDDLVSFDASSNIMPRIMPSMRRILLDGHATLNVACLSCTQDTHTQHTHTQDTRTQAVVYHIKIVHIKFAHINMRATTTLANSTTTL